MTDFAIDTHGTLTPRQEEVFHWKLLGKTDEEVAIIISATHRTIRAHVANIRERMNASNLTHAALIGFQKGFIKTLALTICLCVANPDAEQARAGRMVRRGNRREELFTDEWSNAA